MSTNHDEGVSKFFYSIKFALLVLIIIGFIIGFAIGTWLI